MMETMQAVGVAQIAIWVVTLIIVVTFVVKSWPFISRLVRGINELFGADGRPSAMQRLDGMEDKVDQVSVTVDTILPELKRNHGHSVKDTVARNDERLDRIEQKLDQL